MGSTEADPSPETPVDSDRPASTWLRPPRLLAAGVGALVIVAVIFVATRDGSGSEFAGCAEAAPEREAPAVTAGPTTTLAGVTPTLPPVSVEASSGRTPLPGFDQVTLEVVAGDEVRELCVLLADRAAQRQQGLMGVEDPELGGYDGMLFVYQADRDPSQGFWMKNTPLPLSIVYLDSDGGIVSHIDMEPCPPEAAVCPSFAPTGPYRMALEVPQGGLDQLGLGEGSTAVVRVVS